MGENYPRYIVVGVLESILALEHALNNLEGVHESEKCLHINYQAYVPKQVSNDEVTY